MSLRLTLSRAALRLAVKPKLARASVERLQADNVPDPPPGLRAAHAIEEVETAGTRAIWIDRAAAERGIIVYLHGGGHISGPTAAQWEYLGRLCEGTGAAGLLVDFPLAPQHPFPAALEATFDLARELHAGGELGDGDWVLVGDSAGATLALALAYRLRDSGSAPAPRALVLSSPWLDMTRSHLTSRLQRLDPMLSLPAMTRDIEAYAAGRDLRDPAISPLFGDPSGLPPQHISVGRRELLLAECREWRDRCEAAGASVEYNEQRGGFHGYQLYGWLPEGRAEFGRQAAFIAAHLKPERA